MTEQVPTIEDDSAEEPPAGPMSEPADPRRDAIVDARLAAIATRFGDRWDEEQRARVRSGIARQVDLGARVRRAPLGNADEPEIVFVPFRAPNGAEGAAS